MTAGVFVLGHGYLLIGASFAVALIVGTWLYARNEKKHRR